MRFHTTQFSRAVAVFLVFGACSSGPTSESEKSNASNSSTSTEQPVELVATLGRTSVHGTGIEPGTRAKLDKAIAAKVIAVVDQFVQTSLVGPLEGRPVDFDGLLTPDVATRLATGKPDRSVLTTEGIISASRVHAELAKVRLVALTEGLGSISLISASIDFDATLTSDGTQLTVQHVGEILLAEDSGWKIVGYEMTVTRDDGSSATSETSAVVTP